MRGSATRSPRISLTILLAILIATSIPATSALRAETGGTGGGPISGSILVTVVESGSDDGTGNPLPVPGAFVMVGLSAGDPFVGNTGYTDANGEITFTDAALSGPQTITAGAAGYTYYSFVDANAAEVVLPLELSDPAWALSQVSGSLSGFSGVDCDNWIQLSIVLPTLTLEDLIGFDVASQLTEDVPVDILGTTYYLPGNIVIPTQKENPAVPSLCWLLGADISKPSYVLNLPTGGTFDIFSFGVQLDLGALSGEFDLSNITPLELGIARDVYVGGNTTANINMGSSFSNNLTLITDNIPVDTDVLLLSLGEINGDPGSSPGTGDLVLMDFSQVPGGGGATGDVLMTTPAVAPFGDMRYVALAIASSGGGLDLTGVSGVLDRSGFAPPSTQYLVTYLERVELDPVAGNLFSFTDTVQPYISPQPDLNVSVLSLVTTVPDTSPGAEPGDTVDVTQKLWTLSSPGEDLAFYLPILPPEAPTALPFPEQTTDDDRLNWSHTVVAFGLDPTFDFDAYDLSSFRESFTHFSANNREFSVDADLDGIHLFDDNCPFVANATQDDLDGDGEGDACDPDADGDGSLGAVDDCNDLDPAIHPGAEEICDDGIDNDCDTLTDNDDPECSGCTDGDGDGYYAEGGSCGPVDCDDANGFVNPGEPEHCDGLDNDCNPGTADGSGEAWYGNPCDGPDSDFCQEGAFGCEGGAQTCSDDTGDIPDTCDGLDNDCNPGTPDGADEPWLGTYCDGPDADLCLEGYYSCQGGAQNCSDDTGDLLDLCDGLDNDCNPGTPDGSGEAWYGTPCDGYDTDLCEEGTFVCQTGTQTCNDATGNTLEVCDDGQDNDCDTLVDGNDPDCMAECTDADGDTYSLEGGACGPVDCDDTNPFVHPGEPEHCDGLDNDCDGNVPATEADGDGDTWRICAGDCDDGDPDRYPAAPEICNGQDDDCDGNLPPDETDGDGDGYALCQNDCDDTNAFTYPGAAERCDGLDNDCDGNVPVDETDLDEDGYLGCATDCDDADPSVHPGAPETPGDGVDSNCNGNDDCFIATAAFGSAEEPPVMSLRQFRDRYLLTNAPGRRLVDLYYTYSPPVARFIAGHEGMRTLVRLLLTPVIGMAKVLLLL